MTANKTTALIEHVAKAIIIARDGKRDGERRFQDPIIKKAYIGDAKAALEALAAFEQPRNFKEIAENHIQWTLETFGVDSAKKIRAIYENSPKWEKPSQPRDKDACLSKSADSESQVREMSVDEVAEIIKSSSVDCNGDQWLTYHASLPIAKALAKLGTIRVVEG